MPLSHIYKGSKSSWFDRITKEKWGKKFHPKKEKGESIIGCEASKLMIKMGPNSFRENGNDKQKLKSSVVLKILVWDLEMWNEECIEENAFLLCPHTHSHAHKERVIMPKRHKMNSHA